MAGGGKPEILGKCKCGSILVKTDHWVQEHWSRNPSVVQLVEQMAADGKKVNPGKCPGCGGRIDVPIAGGFHPAYVRTFTKAA